MEKNTWITVVENAAKLPLVKVERNSFLRKNLCKLCTSTQLESAIREGTLNAGIPVGVLDSAAAAVIRNEALKVTTISAAAGIPGGIAMAATIPVDLVQFYGFILRTAQELAYLYGWKELFAEGTELDAATESQLILFIGVMSGVSAAKSAITKLFGEAAKRAVAKKIAAKALTKTWYFPIAKKIAALFGNKLVKSTFANGVAKTVPLLGGAISGGITFAAFQPMANRLKKHLSTLARMTPEEYETAVMQGEAMLSAMEEGKEVWICQCGRESIGRFCSYCGSPKPAEEKVSSTEATESCSE